MVLQLDSRCAVSFLNMKVNDDHQH
ncbi:hypothetical protein LINGRAHAP2_LOCUS28533 [Linum grandiflorum]